MIYRYLWDSKVLLHEWSYALKDRPCLQVDDLGRTSYDRQEPVENVTTWVYETDSFVPCAKLVNNERYSIISDYIGRPIQAYDDAGSLVWETDYDIYGNLENLKGNRNFISFRQLGQYEDEETGLYLNRFRYYSPNTGAYISQDPIGLASGMALYNYVHDANIWVDVFGLKGDYHQIPKIPGYQKHHIIPQSMKHPLLDRVGFDVHQSSNIVQLPTSADIDPTRTVHNGLHNADYDRMITRRLNAIEALDASDDIKRMHLNDVMENVGDDLRNKRIKLNCH